MTAVHRSTRLMIVPLLVGMWLLAACSSAAPAASGGGPPAARVVASFYPLEYITARIGADRVRVENLTPTGAEPHEIELSADNTASLEDADLVVYLSGFAPAVDAAVDDVARNHAIDVSSAARLDLTYTPIEGGQVAGDQRNASDPHFWLDPTRLADVARAVESRLAEVDPQDAALFRTNTDALVADLTALDAEYRDGLASCTNRDIVTSHNAFGYLAERYDMTQVGITGLTPEDEPTPADLASVSAFVEQHHITTIYTETLVSPAIADTVAEETGATTAVLDPLEGLSDATKGSDYLGIMRANLAELRRGQRCS